MTSVVTALIKLISIHCCVCIYELQISVFLVNVPENCCLTGRHWRQLIGQKKPLYVDTRAAATAAWHATLCHLEGGGKKHGVTMTSVDNAKVASAVSPACSGVITLALGLLASGSRWVWQGLCVVARSCQRWACAHKNSDQIRLPLISMWAKQLIEINVVGKSQRLQFGKKSDNYYYCYYYYYSHSHLTIIMIIYEQVQHHVHVHLNVKSYQWILFCMKLSLRWWVS